VQFEAELILKNVFFWAKRNIDIENWEQLFDPHGTILVSLNSPDGTIFVCRIEAGVVGMELTLYQCSMQLGCGN